MSTGRVRHRSASNISTRTRDHGPGDPPLTAGELPYALIPHVSPYIASQTDVIRELRTARAIREPAYVFAVLQTYVQQKLIRRTRAKWQIIQKLSDIEHDVPPHCRPIFAQIRVFFDLNGETSITGGAPVSPTLYGGRPSEASLGIGSIPAATLPHSARLCPSVVHLTIPVRVLGTGELINANVTVQLPGRVTSDAVMAHVSRTREVHGGGWDDGTGRHHAFRTGASDDGEDEPPPAYGRDCSCPCTCGARIPAPVIEYSDVVLTPEMAEALDAVEVAQVVDAAEAAEAGAGEAAVTAGTAAARRLSPDTT